MNDSNSPQPNETVQEKIERADAQLTALEGVLNEIGRPAANHLFDRLEALRIEERALKRNLEENEGKANLERLAKLEALLRHIEREESSVGHEAAFLHQSAPSSVTLAAEAGSRMVGAVGKRLGKILHGHHPFGSSIFVNHTHESLVTYHGLAENPPEKDTPKES